MKLDYKLKEILFEIIREVKEEDDIDISLAEVAAICNSQFVAATYAFSKGIEIRLHKLGAFKRRFTDKIKEGKAKVENLKDTLTKEQIDKLDLEMKINRKKWNNARSKVLKRITLEELLSAPKIVKTQSKYDKLDV